MNNVSGMNREFQHYKKYISSCGELICRQQLEDSGITSSENEAIFPTTLPEPILIQMSSTLSEPPRGSGTDRVEENNSAEYAELVTNSPSTSKVN